MPSQRQNLAFAADPARFAARRIRRLSETLALARLEQVLDQTAEWVMWLGAALPGGSGGGGCPGPALREASRGFERWLAGNTGLLLVVGSELVRRAEVVRSAALVCLRDAARGGADLEAGRRALEASLLELERVLATARSDVRKA
ncbi:MAG TPA: hypothetical protein VFR85_18565 [Anaeromyxobacteraceae bacterium]|nr:hypothetical protein [Anaeromyxobacteraceae bacterium]